MDRIKEIEDEIERNEEILDLLSLPGIWNRPGDKDSVYSALDRLRAELKAAREESNDGLTK